MTTIDLNDMATAAVAYQKYHKGEPLTDDEVRVGALVEARDRDVGRQVASSVAGIVRLMPWTDDGYQPCWTMENSDAWNFDSTLALFIADGCDRLLDMDNGHPCEMRHETWRAILTFMSVQFRRYVANDNCAVFDAVERELFQHALDLLHRHFMSLWD